MLCMMYKRIEESLQKSLNVSRSSGGLEFGLWERRVRLFFQHGMLKVGKEFCFFLSRLIIFYLKSVNKEKHLSRKI